MTAKRTVIQLEEDTRDKLKGLKQNNRETYDMVILRLIKLNENVQEEFAKGLQS